ncbi:hypothetical protein, partial [Brachybacterium sp.]|uniref:hypothetical protein n=1 Tax=Brachybacterium sp. TaxID=1891286 RepID=UPI002ED552A1
MDHSPSHHAPRRLRRGAPTRVGRRTAVLALPVAALSACKVADPFQPTLTVTLTVVEQGWTGWSTEQPEPETSIEEVTEGSEFTRTS